MTGPARLTCASNDSRSLSGYSYYNKDQEKFTHVEEPRLT